MLFRSGSRDDLGQRGEALAARYLRRKGCAVLQVRYRCREGEIDLIAREGDTLCFVEVKTRTSIYMGLPREYVGRQKQARLRAAAARYLSEQALDCPARFDVAEIYIDPQGKPYIHYIENAF